MVQAAELWHWDDAASHARGNEVGTAFRDLSVLPGIVFLPVLYLRIVEKELERRHPKAPIYHGSKTCCLGFRQNACLGARKLRSRC